MALLVDSDRQICARTWIGKIYVELQNLASMNYADVKAAADATDSWVDTNQAAFNTALPDPFKSTATTAQKTAMMCYVAMKRAGIL